MNRLLVVVLTGCTHAPPGFEAILDMDRLEGGKRFQGTWLEKPNGERLLVSYRLVPEYFRFVEKRVLVTGDPYRPGAHEQHIDATHFTVKSIDLAPGETPYDPPPQELPPPPLVTKRAELETRLDRWIEVQGNLRSAGKHADDDWCDAIITLPDTTELTTQIYFTEMESTWKPLVGQPVTVLGKLFREDGKLKLSGPAICPGTTRGCGMK
jgi:hypothetical protein